MHGHLQVGVPQRFHDGEARYRSDVHPRKLLVNFFHDFKMVTTCEEIPREFPGASGAFREGRRAVNFLYEGRNT